MQKKRKKKEYFTKSIDHFDRVNVTRNEKNMKKWTFRLRKNKFYIIQLKLI